MPENKKLPILRSKAMKLPLTPGVYIMKNKDNEIIYIGKAKKLKNRVSQYFGSQRGHSTKVRKMVEHVDDFDYILTDSEFEALVLECSLIKQNMPKYNILLKDDKGYSYIKITKGPWGKISPCFRKDDPDADYLGPYTGNYSVTNACSRAAEIFRLPTCNKMFPRDIKSSRPCLNYFISRCSAPCAGKISQAEYEENLKSAVEFLKNPDASAVKELRDEMEKASENLDFEKAAKLRDRIKAIERISQKQKVVVNSEGDEDVFAVAQRGNKACLSVLSFEQGALKNSEHFIFETSEELSDERMSLITSYYSLDRKIPPLIIVDGEVNDIELVAQWLTEKRGKKVSIIIPQRGDKVRLVQMCLTNAAQKLSEHLGFFGADTAVLDELKKMLGLKKTPEYIEAYDISHTAGSDNVAGMVVFKDARPMRSAYKRFSIKSFLGQDDYGSMREVISRRLNRYIENEGSEEGFGKLPDLILLDGGQGQVSAVKPIIDAFGLDIPVFGMVKDSKHRTRAITDEGQEISINSGRRVFTLISSIQEEVHRFAITYHKTKHSKNSLVLSLTKIQGIGEKKATILLKHFKTLSAIRTADRETLKSVKGISIRDAENIYLYFNESD
ncbi:MAG: excinuclease ABC subunit UvrC [Clostridia bacterium]|nr:excinuclease ABC subunit UvrC [Clostridia bacterium]